MKTTPVAETTAFPSLRPKAPVIGYTLLISSAALFAFFEWFDNLQAG